MTEFKLLLLVFCVFLKTENSFAAPASEKECPLELDLDKNSIEELLQLTSFKSADDSEFQELMGCVWKNKGLVSEDGILSVVNFRRALVKEFRAQFPEGFAEEKAQEVVNFCRDVTGKNAGETAVNMVRCMGRWKVQSFIDNERKQPV